MAKKFSREINFSLHDKLYSAIGFKNDEGGYELCNQWFREAVLQRLLQAKKTELMNRLFSRDFLTSYHIKLFSKISLLRVQISWS